MKKILTRLNRYFMKPKDCLNTTHFDALKSNNLFRLKPSIYTYTALGGLRSIYLDLCENEKHEYEVVSSHQELGAEVGRDEHWVKKTMYRLVFKSVIDAMVCYETMKSAIAARGSFSVEPRLETLF